MSMRLHQLPRKVFAELATGGGGQDAVSHLAAAEHSKHMTLIVGVLGAAQGGEQYQLARQGYDLLTAAWRADRDAAETVIRHPSVGVWARRTIQACRGGPVNPGAEPGGLRTIAAAAAIRAGLPTEVEVAVTDGRVMLSSLGTAEAPGDSVIVRSGRGHVKVGPVEVPGSPGEDAPGWLGLRRVRAGSLSVLIDDLDPFRMPDVPDLAPRQQHSAREWETAFGQAWPLLERHHPVTAAEIAATVSVIVPRTGRLAGVVSTSSPEAFGAVAMSFPPDPVTCAETLAHEIQHLKLSALMDIVTLTEPDDGRRYYAPWRDDPRPLSGLLQGAYAYLGVSGFWRRQRRLDAGPRQPEAEFARWREAAAGAVETLRSSGRLTPPGLDFVSGMARTLTAWREEPVSATAQYQARRAAQAHLARWQSVNGALPDRFGEG
ncbi:MAG TPA: HEXXH motif domain-containing protein [Streptosporangiaceae bacterium]|nr:HEXXH motif domain-containing protein [Streptosporangiaceae bacterium]